MLSLESVYFGQKHPNFDYKDYDLILKISRLARKHDRQATNDCNGEGFVNGQHYYAGNIDEWAKSQYGQGVKSAYVGNSDVTIFNAEMDRIEAKINKLIADNPKFSVEYQGDPRGYTVRLSYEGELIEW